MTTQETIDFTKKIIEKYHIDECSELLSAIVELQNQAYRKGIEDTIERFNIIKDIDQKY